MKICPNEKCGEKARQPDSIVFCSGCGIKLVEASKCKGCDGEIGHYDNFCPSCGRPLK